MLRLNVHVVLKSSIVTEYLHMLPTVSEMQEQMFHHDSRHKCSQLTVTLTPFSSSSVLDLTEQTNRSTKPPYIKVVREFFFPDYLQTKARAF